MVSDVTREEQTLIDALAYLKNIPQWQVVQGYFGRRVMQTLSSLMTATNDEMFEARGRYKEAKAFSDYVNKV